MATIAEKALAAVIEYDRLMRAIGACGIVITDPANECCLDKTGSESSHLSDIFAGDVDNEGIRRYAGPGEVAEMLSECAGCRKKFDAIQERKRLKKSLATVKRSIRVIARNAEKVGEK